MPNLPYIQRAPTTCHTASTPMPVETTTFIAITVSNPCTRHPAVAASACASVQQISEGRFRFGMSSGDSALRNIGVQPGSVELMERYMRAIQAMTAGETFDWEGHPVGLHWLPRPARVPVWIAAEGPRTQRMAGRYADGVVLSNCLTPERLAVAMEHLSAGAAEVGRSVDDIEIWHGHKVPFMKRAQLTAADLGLAFERDGWGRFDDLDQLTIFADNLVPHVLRVDGILDYDPDLAAHIDRGDPLEVGSVEEIEIRAAAVHAVELLKQHLHADGHRHVTAMDLDYLLWNRGQAERYKAIPRHRARGVFY